MNNTSSGVLSTVEEQAGREAQGSRIEIESYVLPLSAEGGSYLEGSIDVMFGRQSQRGMERQDRRGLDVPSKDTPSAKRMRRRECVRERRREGAAGARRRWWRWVWDVYVFA